MIAAYDEVRSEYLNSLVEIDGGGVPAHRLRACLITVGCDGVAVEFEVAERPEDGFHRENVAGTKGLGKMNGHGFCRGLGGGDRPPDFRPETPGNAGVYGGDQIAFLRLESERIR